MFDFPLAVCYSTVVMRTGTGQGSTPSLHDAHVVICAREKALVVWLSLPFTTST